jgi:hypothetical protein
MTRKEKITIWAVLATVTGLFAVACTMAFLLMSDTPDTIYSPLGAFIWIWFSQLGFIVFIYFIYLLVKKINAILFKGSKQTDK